MPSKTRKMTKAVKASINAMTLEEIDKSIWICKKDLYIVAKNEFDEFSVQKFDGGDASWEIGSGGSINEVLQDIKKYIISAKFFYICHYKDIDMESILVERGI